MEIFFKLIIGHFLCDFPLQGDFLAKAKNHNAPIPGVPWWIALIAHSAIQGGMVWFVTGEWYFGLIEFGLHSYCDWLKNDGKIGFGTDQALHLACKGVYALWL